jgi:hypothetical protein
MVRGVVVGSRILHRALARGAGAATRDGWHIRLDLTQRVASLPMQGLGFTHPHIEGSDRRSTTTHGLGRRCSRGRCGVARSDAAGSPSPRRMGSCDSRGDARSLPLRLAPMRLRDRPAGRRLRHAEGSSVASLTAAMRINLLRARADLGRFLRAGGFTVAADHARRPSLLTAPPAPTCGATLSFVSPPGARCTRTRGRRSTATNEARPLRPSAAAATAQTTGDPISGGAVTPHRVRHARRAHRIDA